MEIRFFKILKGKKGGGVKVNGVWVIKCGFL